VTTPHADTVARSETVAAPEIAVDAAAGTALWHTIMRGGLIGSAFRLVTLLVSFVVTPIAITHAGTTSYGLFASLTAFAGLLTFADLGIGNGAIREIIASRRDPSSGSESDVIATALTVLSIAGLLVPWQSLLNAPAGSGTTLRWAVAFGSLAIGCAVPGALAQRVLLARQQPGRASAWISLGSIAGSIAVLVAVLAGHHVPAMVAAQLGGPAVIALVSLWVVATRGGWARSTARASKTVALRLLAGGRLFAFLQIVAVVNFEVDNLVVARLRGPTDVTTFAATGRLFAIPWHDVLPAALGRLCRRLATPRHRLAPLGFPAVHSNRLWCRHTCRLPRGHIRALGDSYLDPSRRHTISVPCHCVVHLARDLRAEPTTGDAPQRHA
jgi:hypothetical protein